MAARKKWIGVAVAGFVIATVFGANGPLGGFWGGDNSEDDIPGGALAGLIVANLVESIAFGIGLAWLAFGWSLVKDRSRRLAMLTYASVGWGLVSWFPHSSMHIAWEDDAWYTLAAIEWAFHITLIAAGLVIATFVWQTLRELAPDDGRPHQTATA